jgi:hypothetical protein
MPSTTYYVALPFIDSEDGPVPVEPVECQSAGGAKSTAAALERDAKYVGAVAFQRTGDPDTGDFGDAEIIGRYGETPSDLSAL